MATASVTNTFTNATTAEAADVNQNFSDLVSFINTNAIQKDGSTSMTAALTLSGDPTSANHAARKSYVDKYKFTPVNGTVTTGAIGSGTTDLCTITVTDPGYNISYFAVALLAMSGTALDYWRLQWYLSDIADTRGGIVIPMAQTGVPQSFAAMLTPAQTHTTGSNLTVKLQSARHSGTGTASIVNDAHYYGATLYWTAA